MAKLEISTLVGCPLKCSYCPQDAIGKVYTGPRLMSVETFRSALAHTPAGIPVSFAGFAEPYLNRECSTMIALAAVEGRPVQVYTTGAGMNESDVELLVRIQPYTLVLHVPDAEGDMKLKVTGAYAALMKSLAARVRSFKAVCFGTIPEPLKWAEKYVVPNGRQSRAGNVTHLVTIKRPKVGSLRCVPSPKLDHSVMIPNGSLTVCCQDYSLAHVIGNLASETWDAIQSGPQITALRAAMASENKPCLCRTCEYSAPN